MIGYLACGKRLLDWVAALPMNHAPARLVSIETNNEKQGIEIARPILIQRNLRKQHRIRLFDSCIHVAEA